MHSGVNKKCQQCVGLCKQWKQQIVVYCPSFRSTQKKDAKPENRETLHIGENGKTGHIRDDYSE